MWSMTLLWSYLLYGSYPYNSTKSTNPILKQHWYVYNPIPELLLGMRLLIITQLE